MQALLGVIFHFIGGFASGSFYIPYKQVKGWAWESYWIVGGLFSWLIVTTARRLPDHSGLYRNHRPYSRRYPFSDLLFWCALGHRRPHVRAGGTLPGRCASGSSIILGLCSVFGALIPLFITSSIRNREGHDFCAFYQ